MQVYMLNIYILSLKMGTSLKYLLVLVSIIVHTISSPYRQFCLNSKGQITSYNPDTHICCQGEIFDRGEALHPTGCCENINDTNCCGIFTYASATDVQCCNGKIQNALKFGCCGKDQIPFLLRNEKCCGNDVIRNNSTCCAGQPISEQQICCHQDLDRNVKEHAINKSSLQHDRCCASFLKSTSYSGNSSVCHSNGTVLPRTREPYCGGVFYDYNSDLCCNNKVFKGERVRGKRCCYPGSSTFDPSKQMCRHGNAKPKKRRSKGIKCGENCHIVDLKKFLRKVRYNDKVKFLIRIGNKNRWKIVRKIINGKIVRTKNRKAISIRPRKDIPSTVGEVLYVEHGSKQYLTYYDNIQRLSEKIARKQNDHRQP